MPLELAYSHNWDLTPDEAIVLQENLREKVVIEPLAEDVATVGGVDVGFPGGVTRAAVAVFDYPDMRLVDSAIVEQATTYPYIPGLLSFREVPAVISALEKLHVLPDVLMVDGQGIAHPRRIGLASHIGVLLDSPTIGCAKSVLVGRYEALDEAYGSMSELRDGDEVIGMVVRSRYKVKPVVVSVGHRVDLQSAVELVLTCTRGYRLPEPTRQADKLASRKAK